MITPTDETIKEVEVPVEKVVEVEKIVEVPVEKEVEKIVEVTDPDLISEAQELRAEKVDGFIEKLEKKIEKFKGKIEDIDKDIEDVQDDIDAKQDDIGLLVAQISSKQSLIDFYTEEDYLGYLDEIRALEDEIIALEDEIKGIEDDIDLLNEEIADLEESKDPFVNRIELDEKCISEIEQYIEDGSALSEDVKERLQNLNLI
ncbi:MAG: hypothetical protein ACOC5T_03490 [Elusimicrobiota bacterium]